MEGKKKSSKGVMSEQEKVKDRFPRIVIVICIAEFCERFSFSGMKAFLTLYLRSKLGYSDDGATETYHLFCMFAYVFPIFGGILADNYLGKFRTILYMLFVYAAGNILVAVTAVPVIDLPRRLCTIIGLVMISIGTGGIKPCVAAFGGDQFKLPQQERYLAIYFSFLYFILCVAALISKTVSPILRSEIQCFGDKDCYSIAFAAPGLIILIAIAIFFGAKSQYIIKKPEGNVVFGFIKCVYTGINHVILKKKRRKDSHWLDSTTKEFEPNFVEDVKKTLKILSLFTVLPVFWSLLDQMGSRWTLQATKMDGRFGFVTIKPDQLQVVAPVFILILIPLSQKYIYPFLEKRYILRNPLHKLTLAGVLAGIAFINAGVVEMYLKTTYPVLPKPGECQLRLYNGNLCPLTISNIETNLLYTIPPLEVLKKDIKVSTLNDLTMNLNLSSSCEGVKYEKLVLEDGAAISFYLVGDEIMRFEENLSKSRSGFPIVRLLTPPYLRNKTISLYNQNRNEIEAIIKHGVSDTYEVFTSRYTLWIGKNIVKSDIDLGSGGVYTIMVSEKSKIFNFNKIVLTEPNFITMGWLLPQFMIISVAEVLFAVTGNEFAFKESPESMRAVMNASWLLTEAFGNVIIIVITRVFASYGQEIQFFIYSGLMFLSMIFFYVISRNYKPQAVMQLEGVPKSCRSNSDALYLQVKQTDDCLDH